uniref:Metalloendopeptidase n=1 Tax=Alepocephalus longiceps TaxID=492026 RepID=E2RWN8_9TELE|nr:hatching enzyme [Alepocephalus longiceps]
MEHRASLSLLVLLLGFSQALPLTDDEGTDGFLIDDPDIVDLTTRILASNNGSSELLVEGDLVVPRTRNAMRCWNKNNCLWRKSSNGLVEVPYTLSSDFYYYYKWTIENALKSFHSKTCIRFVPRSSQSDYISIENRDGCYSSLGRTGGKQVLSLNMYGCVYHGIIQHELNHALGFNHEQTRSDRDQYVRINWDKIQSHTVYNFHKQNSNNLNTPYDYSSIMHYGRTAFAIQYGQETITPIPDSSVEIGQRQDMSDIDILRINRLYGC